MSSQTSPQSPFSPQAITQRTTEPTAPAFQETSTIHIRGLQARCIIGIRDWERRRRQKVRIDIAFEADLRAAARLDDMAQAVDYKVAKDKVLRYVESSRHQLLEALAGSIADLLLEDAHIQCVDVTVDKPWALSGARSVGVQIVRRRLTPSGNSSVATGRGGT